MGVPVKRLRAEKIKSPNGEVHFFVEESSFPERSENIKYLDEGEIKKSTKRKASKLLFLTRYV